MKIGMLVPGFSADERDWCIPAHRHLMRSLSSEHEVHVFALRYPHRVDVYTVDAAIVHSLNGQARHGSGSAILWTNALNAIRREHSRSPFDVLHSIFGAEAGFLTVLASRWLKVPSVVSLLGGELVGLKDIAYGQDLQWRQRHMNGVAIRLADRVLCGSRRIAELAMARAPKEKSNHILTLPLGVDTEMFAPSPARGIAGEERKREFSILNVGSLVPVKDQATLLLAMAAFLKRSSNACLTIIGGGPLLGRLRDLASMLEIAPHVEFTGTIPHDGLAPWYQRADLFVQSSRHEGEGMAVLEAASSGVPLVGTDVGVMADLAAKGAALTVPTRDADALSTTIARALHSSSLLRARGLELVRSEYDLRLIERRLTRVYTSLKDSDW